MSFPDRRTANILLTILLFAAVFAILYAARRVLLIFVFAILFAYLIDPVVSFLQRHSLFSRNLRGPHVVEVYLAFLLLLVFAGHALAPRLVSINSKLFRTVPVVIEGLSNGEVAAQVGHKYGWSESQEQRLSTFLIEHEDQIQSFLRGLERFTANALALSIVVPILALFFLADGEHIADGFIQVASTEATRQSLREVADELNIMLRKYIRAKVILGGLSLVFYSAAMLLLGFPHAIVLGALGGILEFIPVAGWMISATAILVVGAVTHSHWIWMAALLGIWRMFMDYFISPRVVGQNLEIHPLMVLFAVMVGGEIGGIVGVYLSIPLMVVVRVIWQKWVSATPGARATPEIIQTVESN
jgi:predicted PurR-regulated permease PerM